MSFNNQHNMAFFPPQKKTESQKTEKWYKECIDSSVSLALLDEGSSKRKMQVYEDLDNDIINEQEIENVFNPLQIEYAAFPASMKNYPLSVPKIDLLQGEELNRRYDWVVRNRNESAYSAAQTDLQKMLMEIMTDELTKEAFDEKDAEQRVQKFSKYAKYEWKDVHELTATRILKYLWREQDMKDKTNKGFREALVKGQEIYRIDVAGDEPYVNKCNPKQVYTIRRGSSERIEDSDIIVEINYEPISSVVDEFYDDLKPSEVSQIEAGRTNTSATGGSVLNYNAMQPTIYSNLDPGPNGEGFAPLNEMQGAYNLFGLPYDTYGNVRIVRTRWVGRRKVGRLTSFDENGDEKKSIVSEYYKPDKEAGEIVKWLWINEAYEGTLIGDDIYVRMKAREVQMRHFDNISKCFLGYVGTDYGKSLMSRMEPYQYIYNVYMRRLELALAKYKGPIYELDVSKIPDEWSMDKWMYYADVLGWAPVDPFNEGKKGSGTGRLTGTMQQGTKVLDANIGNFIQQIVMMLQYIENQMGEIAGVTKQRQGQVDNRETVGGVERAVTQSSHITERWFFIHDETKRRVMQALLDTAKHVWKKTDSKKLNFIMDDMSRVFLEFNPTEFASSEFDLFVSSSVKDMEINQALNQLAQAAVQNGLGLGTVVRVLREDSISAKARQIDEAEDMVAQRAEAAQKSQAEAEEKKLMSDLQEKEKDRELEYYKIEVEADLKRAEIASRSNEEADVDNSSDIEKISLDRSKLNLDERKHQDDVSIKSKTLEETKRSNKAKEGIAKSRPKTSSK